MDSPRSAPGRCFKAAPALLLLAGAALLYPAESAADDAAFPMSALVSHVEFLGYKCEAGKTGGTTCKHPVKINFSAKPLGSGLLMTAFFTGKEKPLGLEKLNLTNVLNTEATLARFYWDKDGDLAIEAWIAGSYDKARFSIVMDAWDSDTGLLSKHRDDVLKVVK